jgi:hypothetical protein
VVLAADIGHHHPVCFCQCAQPGLCLRGVGSPVHVIIIAIIATIASVEFIF